MIRLALLAASAVILASGPALAQEKALPTKGNAEVQYSIVQTDLVKLLDKLGLKHEPSDYKDGYEWVETKDGWVFHIGTAICDVEGYPKGCLGGHMIAYWDIDKADAAATRDAIETFNNGYQFAKAWLKDDKAFIERYVIFDNGTTLGNIEANIENFVSFLGIFDEILPE